MKLPNGYGSVVKLSGKRRKPYMVRKTTGYRIDPVKEKKIAEYIIIGYARTKSEGLEMLADYNHNPYDTKAAKMTFSEVYEEWSKKKYPTVSESNVKGYTASYKACTPPLPPGFQRPEAGGSSAGDRYLRQKLSDTEESKDPV